MTYRKPARAAVRRRRSALLAALVALAGVLGYQSLASSAAPTPLPAPPVPTASSPAPTVDAPRREAAGAVPDGVTVFDDEIVEVANLDPELLGALRAAATDAADEGVTFLVNSGWRSPEYQEGLREEAILQYGSEAEAARWVATAETSPHVSGDAVDIGPAKATAWLSEHGAEYGLCQIYGNETWHYELRPDAIDQGCPPMYADPTQDPRMQR